MLCNQATAARAFSKTVETYISCHELSPIAAIQIDGGRSHKWTPQSAEYICDVEITTHRVLTTEAFHSWCCLVRKQAGLPAESVPDAVASRIVAACGQIYYARRLDQPANYFRRVRLRKKEGA